MFSKVCVSFREINCQWQFTGKHTEFCNSRLGSSACRVLSPSGLRQCFKGELFCIWMDSGAGFFVQNDSF